MSMSKEMQAILREPFPPEKVGVLPRITCDECKASAGRACNRHKKGRCPGCKQWITDGHIHLSYVGHAAVTDRLLKADPNWTWTPMYRDVDPAVLAAAAGTGDPAVIEAVIAASPARRDENGGLWILLRVGGVVRPGYGTDDQRGPDREKRLISDAIRNAAMRFGVALDLWSKEDLGEVPIAEFAPRETPPPAPPGRDWIGQANACADVQSLLQLSRLANEAGAYNGKVREAFMRRREEFKVSTPERGTAQ
jgi:hypothetical protein